MKKLRRYATTTLTSLLLASCVTSSTTKHDNLPRAVTMNETVSNNIKFLYDNITARPGGVEFALCLYGKVVNDTIRLERTSVPFIHEATRTGIVYRRCEAPDYIGELHSHPPGPTCNPSTVDIKNFIANDKAMVSLIVCSHGRTTAIYRPRDPAAILELIVGLERREEQYER